MYDNRRTNVMKTLLGKKKNKH